LETTGILAIVGILSIPERIMAQPSTVPSVTVLDNIDIDGMLVEVRNYFFGIIIVACVFMILWAALDIVTAGDNETKVENGKKRLKYAVIGLVLAACSAAIVGILRSIVQ
jgi:hypothetical protein